MFKAFDQKNEISNRELTLFESVVINPESFGDTYSRKYNNASWYHISSSVSGYLGYFETCYSGTPTAVSTSALFDMTYGMSTGSTWYASTVNEKEQKANIYKIFAAQLLGSPSREFSWAGTTYKDLFFITLKRNIFKDYIKPQTVTMWLTASVESEHSTLTASDSCVSAWLTDYAGTYGPILSCSTSTVQGLVFYNAGVLALATASLYGPYFSGAWHMNDLLTGSDIDHIVDGLRAHVNYITFNAATRVHSTAYKCVLLDKEFNYSSNPTFVDSTGLIRVMSGSLAITPRESRIYITKIGIYDDQDNLLAVAATSYPVMKTPQQTLVFTVRNDY